MGQNTVWTFRPVKEVEADFLEIREWAEAHGFSTSYVINTIIPRLKDALYNTTHYDSKKGTVKFVADFGIIELKIK